MKQIKVRFSAGKLSLEGVLSIPEGSGPFPAVIVCHPHPLYGGSMDNNVVHALSEALVQASVISFKFNFRGVGQSEGSFSHGIGEQEDVAAAISFLTRINEVDPRRIGLVGYSAGAAFALPVGCNEPRIRALAAVSPPLPMFDFAFIKDCAKPKLFVLGSKDSLISLPEFQQFCRSLLEPNQCAIVEGADHFWWGYESSLASVVVAFFNRTL
jgi:alpha/beta superfamily hydrolase